MDIVNIFISYSTKDRQFAKDFQRQRRLSRTCPRTLTKPCGISLAGTPIDLSKIKAPTFILSTHEDHIAPWKSTYAATRLYSGPVKFVLSTSGRLILYQHRF